MRIAMLVWTDRSPAGGRTRQVRDLEAGLAERGYEVEVIDAREVGPRGLQQLAAVDVVHAHGGMTPAIAALSRVASMRRPALVCTLHGWHTGASAALERGVEFAGLRFCDAITVPNQVMIDRLPRVVRARTTVVVNGVRAVPVRTPGSGTVRVMWAGRVCREKGIDTAVRAFALTLERQPNMELRIVGPVDDAHGRAVINAALARLPTRVRYDGFDAHPWRRFPADVLLHTPRYDACPRVIIEAFAHGAAVLAIGVGGIPELVQHEVTGLLTADGDVDGLSDHLARLADDGELRERLATRARKRFEARYSLEVMAGRMDAIYRRVRP